MNKTSFKLDKKIYSNVHICIFKKQECRKLPKKVMMSKKFYQILKYTLTN